MPVAGCLIATADQRRRVWCGALALPRGTYRSTLGPHWLFVHARGEIHGGVRTVDSRGRLLLTTGDLDNLGAGPLLLVQVTGGGLILSCAASVLSTALGALVGPEVPRA